jgi:hypothetical protein
VLAPFGVENVHFDERGIAAQKISNLAGLADGQADTIVSHEFGQLLVIARGGG